MRHDRVTATRSQQEHPDVLCAVCRAPTARIRDEHLIVAHVWKEEDLSNSRITKRVIGTGAAVAVSAGIGLAMSATPAHADVWDRVAACESGNNWSINTGNGFYGGLQFTQSTWRAYGGSGSPQNASKAEQKRVARNVLKGQGPGAWPVCSRKAGLTSSNGGASSSYTSSSSSKSYSAHKSTSTKKTYSSKSTTPKKTYSTKSYSSKSYSTPTGKKITIHSGDTLAKLAAKYHVSGGYRALQAKNHIANANLIFAGHTLYI